MPEPRFTNFVHRLARPHRDTIRLDPPRAAPVPIVVASPHSGRLHPAELQRTSALPMHELRRSEDRFVDLLCAAAPACGMPLLAAVRARAWLDLNRSPMALDPAILDEPPPGCLMDPDDERLAAGLGVIPRLAEGRPIHRLPLERHRTLARIAHEHLPWHRLLARLLARLRDEHGAALLIDCHSMPRFAQARGHAALRMPDIVLGDRHGTSAAPHLVEKIAAHFSARGYRVARNRPFAGGHTTERHGRPTTGRHALQIEIARHLYMDETSGRPHAGFDRLRRDMTALFANLAEQARRGELFDDRPRPCDTRHPLAAE